MNFKQLHYFVTVAKVLHITKAAELLHCVQSNVSNTIKQLEEELNLQLFERQNKRIYLTPHGHQLLPYAEHALTTLDNVRFQAGALLQEDYGQLIIGSMEAIASTLLAKCLPKFHQHYPKLELQLITGNTEELLNRLKDGEIDIALTGKKIKDPDYSCFHLGTEELQFITSNQQANSDKNELPSTLLTFKKGCAYRKLAEDYLSSISKVPANILEYGSYEAIIGCVAANMGFSIIPKPILEKSQFKKLVLSKNIPSKYLSCHIYLICKSYLYQYKGKCIDAMINMLSIK